MIRSLCLTAMLLCAYSSIIFSQTNVKGKIIDETTNEPLSGVNITTVHQQANILSDQNGNFFFNSHRNIDTILISYIGYQSKKVAVSGSSNLNIFLAASFANLDEVIVSGNRDVQKRREVPAAIQVISKSMINDTKATRVDMLVNKVPGVFMVDLGNEQHSMAIRQPLGYNSLYLYLEDGIPIRTTGDFNHNALIEINQASLGRIEVIKGPASSLYGSEAVGGAINFITQSPSLFPAAKLQAETGSRGYRRADFFVSNTIKKTGIYLGGYYANQNQADDQHNDFHKVALTLRVDHSFNPKTKWVTTASYINYHTDQKGGLDSIHFYNRDYSSFYRFTYREVNAFRLKTLLTHTWNENNKTSASVFFRRSAIGQNPFYYIVDVPGSISKSSGQVNEDAFNSYGTIIQHVKTFNALQAKWITGLSADFSPATYYAKYIDIDRDNKGVYYNYRFRDSSLTDYNVDLLNTAIYTQFEINPAEQLKFVAAARYDRLDYKFDNHLSPGAFTGAPDTKDHFDHFTPKIGVTYNPGRNIGIYANYSVGFAPPNITDLYTGVKVPALKPSSYHNYETGGWLAFAKNKGYAEVSLYQLDGTNEIVNVRLSNGTYQNQNAGQTRHRGIEANLKYILLEQIIIRVGGTFAEHKYTRYLQEGNNFSGNKMPQAPLHILNSEITYKPVFLKGFRIAVEYQGVGKYYTDQQNTRQYKGFNVFNARMGYTIKGIEVWANCINIADAIYATTVEKSAYGTSYRPGQLRTLNIGLGYNFGKQFN